MGSRAPCGVSYAQEEGSNFVLVLSSAVGPWLATIRIEVVKFPTRGHMPPHAVLIAASVAGTGCHASPPTQRRS